MASYETGRTLLQQQRDGNGHTSRKNLFLNNQSDVLINQIYSVIKPYMFRATSLPTIRSFPS